MTDRFDQLIDILESKDPDLAAHLRMATELMNRPGGIHLKMAAHALREFGVLLPTALGVERRRKGDGLKLLRALTPQWRALPMATRGVGPSEASDSDASTAAESSIPTALLRDTQQAYDALGNEADFAEIMAAMVRTLDPLGDPTFHAKTGPEVRHWHRLHSWFVSRCHATSLQALELERAEFVENWRLYEASLGAMFGRAIDTIPELLSLAASSPEDPGVLDRAMALLKKAEPRRRFFFALNNPEWLAPLEARRLLDDPYPPVRTDDLISFPQWPQSHFLINIADRAGADVARLIQRIGPLTENATVQADFVHAAMKMPVSDAARLVGVFGQWLVNPAYMRVGHLLGTLGARLARGGETEAALELIGALLRFDAPPPDGSYNRSVVPRIGRYVYESALKEIEKELVKDSGLELLDLLCHRLSLVIRAEKGNNADDHSWIWMRTLRTADEYSEGVKETLATAVVRVASSIAVRSSSGCAQAIGRLRRESFLIFRRIELHVLARRVPDSELVRERLMDAALFENDRVRLEYDRLLAISWDHLAPRDQEQFLGWIRRGPDQQWLIEAETERQGETPSDDRLRRHRESWQLARLQPIAGTLTGEGMLLLEELTERGVEAAPPLITGVQTWVGPTSPLSSEELKGMSSADLLGFLREWAPPSDPMSDSREGLARRLTEHVAADTKHWSELATEFQRGIDPTYVRSFLEGLSLSAANQGAITWEPLLELCARIVTQPREIGGARDRDEDPDWSWTCRTIASLLQRGLQRDLGLPFENRQAVWAIIEALSADSDPDGDQAVALGTAQIRDAEVVALNSVRGVALHAAVEYALWCVRNLKAQGRTPGTWLEEIPEARKHFEAKLDRGIEPSTAVPTVLAHYLPNLHFLDREWFGQQLPKLFSELGPAWQVYLLYGQLHEGVAPLLAPYYLRAAKESGTALPHEHADELERRLPEHLLLLHAYLGEKMPSLGKILEEFFENAPARLRAHLVGFAGWHVEDEEAISPAARDRIMKLVERRVVTAVQSSDPGAREELSEWASLCRAEEFPDGWLIRIARIAVPACPGSQSEMWVGERMAKIADTDLAAAMDVLGLVSVRDLGPLGIHSWNEPAEKILSLSVARDGELRDRAVEAINNFSEGGYSQFEHLLTN